MPDEAGVAGATRIAAIAAQAGEDDLVLCLISGGASALLPLPADPITLAEKQATTALLLACGANIHEINAVRKHISRIKGGQLARLAAPATVESLLLSDVIGDDLDVIGSGPTAPGRFHLRRRPRHPGAVRPAGARARGRARAPGARRPRRNPRDSQARRPPFSERVRNVLVGNSRLALDAAARSAPASWASARWCCPARFRAKRATSRACTPPSRAKLPRTGQPVKPPACIITGGETTVTLRGAGLGRRNQEFVLAAALDIAGLPGVVVFSAGTDGTDGPTDAAGAIADGDTLQPQSRRAPLS